MPVLATCPDCGHSVSVGEESLGRKGRCRKCGKVFRIERSGAGPSAEATSGPSSSSPPRSTTDPANLPEQFGRYRIMKQLGQGGMGAVYLAHDVKLDRRVALKVPFFHPADGPQAIQRFEREARAAATLDHPNLCPIYDIGEVDGIHYLTMPYIEGRPLSEAMAEDQVVPEAQAAALVCKLALALQSAHERGIVHRDLKPGNIMVKKGRDLVIMDFGLARMDDGADAPLTRTGHVLGTALYMAPEQAAGDIAATGPASDVYSLGVILYELLTGRRPFEGPWSLVIGLKNVQDPEPPSRHRPGLAPALDAICRKALARDPKGRYPTMAEFAAALGAQLTQAPASAPPPTTLGAAPRPLVPETLASQVFAGLVGDEVASLREEKSPARLKPERPKPSTPEGEPSRPPRAWIVATAGAAACLALGLVVYVVTGKGGTGAKGNNPAAVDKVGDRSAGVPKIEQGAGGAKESAPKGGDGSKAESAAPTPDEKPNAVAIRPEAPASGTKGTKAGDGWEGWRDGRVPPGLTIDHPTVVSTVAFSPDGRTIASAYPWSKEVQIADARTGKAVLEIKTDHQNEIWALAFHPNGKQIVTGLADYMGTGGGVYKIWDVANGSPIRTLVGSVALLGDASYTADGRYLLGRGRGGLAVVFDAETGEERRVLRLEGGKVKGWVGSPTDRTISYSSEAEPGVIKTINLDDGSEVDRFRVEPRFKIARFFRDGKRVLVVDGTAQSVWDRSTGKEAVRFDPAPENLSRRGLTPDGHWLIGGTRDDGTIHVWDTSTGREVASFQAHDSTSWGLSISEDGRRFASGSYDKTTKIWDLPATTDVASRSFFNGKDMDGWEGLPDYWRVEGGAIVGTWPPGRPAQTFLCSKRSYRDFELRFKARCKNGVGNTGVQIRSWITDRNEFKVSGPQCEIGGKDDGRRLASGSLVTEPTRDPAIAADRARVDPIYKNADFNDFQIRCVGKHVQIRLNGLVTVDADFPTMPDEGIIAWQMHGKETPEEVVFKDISLVELGGPPAPIAGNPAIPDDAKPFGGRHFKVFGREMSWHEARQKCAEMGGHLAIVRDKAEDDFLARMISKAGLTAAWLGATDEATEGSWRWVDGSVLGYWDWNTVGLQPGEKGTLEHFLMMRSDRNGWKWYDQPDRPVGPKAGFVCQWDAESAGKTADALRPGSAWKDNLKHTPTVLEREGNRFKARFRGPNYRREIQVTISGNHVSWYPSDVTAIEGGPGDTDVGEIRGRSISFRYFRGGQSVGSYVLTLDETP